MTGQESGIYSELDRSIIEDTLAVIDRVYEFNEDSNYSSTLMMARDRFFDIYSGYIGPIPEEVTAEMVETAFRTLKDIPPPPEEQRLYFGEYGGRHFNDVFGFACSFVDTESKFVNGALPPFREWNAKFVCDGEVIRDVTYKYVDEYSTNPVIDGTQYKSIRTDKTRYKSIHTGKYNGDIIIYLKEQRNDVHIVVNGVDNSGSYVDLSIHPGPDQRNIEHIVSVLCREFEWAKVERGRTELILSARQDDVVEYIEKSRWRYEDKR